MDEYAYAAGKYTIVNDNGKLTTLRCGGEWRDLRGDNLRYHKLVETMRLREVVERVVASADECDGDNGEFA